MNTLERGKRILANHLFEYFWNDTIAEYRRFIVPDSVSITPLQGTADLGYGAIDMPNPNAKYWVYKIDSQQLAQTPYGSYYENDEDPVPGLPGWTSFATLMDDSARELRAYGVYGRQLYRPKVYWRSYAANRYTLMAVEYRMAKHILNAVGVAPNLLIEVYLDIDDTPNLSTEHYYLINNESIQTAYAACNNKPGVLLNGKLIELVSVDQLSLGDYVERVDDGNVFQSFNVDPFYDNTTWYYSDYRKESMVLIHIPKAMNPTNRVFTVNTLDLYAVFEDYAVLLHQGYRDTRGVVQLTHNDFSVPKEIIEQYRVQYGDTFQLRVVIRDSPSSNTMQRDSSYVDILYDNHDDATICRFLVGNNTPLRFWRADELEQSPYGNALLRTSQFSSDLSVEHYIGALGYYQAMSLMYDQVIYGIVDITSGSGTIPFFRPEMMIGDWIHPHVYIDGIKVPDTGVFTSYDSGTDQCTTTITLAVDDGTYELVMELHENPNYKSYRVRPVTGTTTFNIDSPSSRWVMFREHVLPTDTVLKGVGTETSTVYIPVDLDLNGIEIIDDVDTNTSTVTFSAELLDNVFIIQPKDGMILTTTFDTLTVPGVISATPKVITYDGIQTVTPEGEAPLLVEYSPLVFINDRILTNGADYQVVPVRFSNHPYSMLGGYQIVIQNIEFLEYEGNRIEAYSRLGINVESVFGHPQPGNITGLDELLVWFPSISLAYSDGYVLPIGSWASGTFVSVLPVDAYGALSGAHTVTPSQWLKDWPIELALADNERLTQLRAYMRSLITPPKLVVIRKTHDIYSVYLSQVITSIVQETEGVLDGGSVDVYQLEITAKRLWDRLKSIDLVYKGTLDTRFIDFFPTYTRHNVQNRQVHQLIQKITSELDLLDQATDRNLFS